MGITFPKTSLEYVHMPDITIRILEIHSQKMGKYDVKDLYRYLTYLKEFHSNGQQIKRSIKSVLAYT